MDLYIGPELQAIIPPPTAEEHAQLEANLLAEGCRDPLVVWAGEPPARVCPSCPPGTPFGRATTLIEARKGSVVWLCGFCDHGEQRSWIILDGHTRYDICRAHGLDFTTVEAPTWVQTRLKAKMWMIQNQLARRNLEPYQRAELVLQIEPLIAAKGKENQQRGGGTVRLKSDNPVDTLKQMAQQAGIGRDTMHKAKVIAQEADEPTKAALRRGERTIHGAYQELHPPRPASALADRAERDDGVKEANPKTARLRLPSGRVKTVREAQHDTQAGTSTTEPATGHQLAAQMPSPRSLKVRGRMSLRRQANLRQQVVSRLAESPAIREARIGRKSGVEVLQERLSRLWWPDCVLLAAYVLRQAEAAPAAWVEAATAAWAEADEDREATATLSTSAAPRLDAMSTEEDSMPAAVASADDPFPNLEDVAL
jgi:hypothetical protein